MTTLILVCFYTFNLGPFFTLGQESKTEKGRLESLPTLGNEIFVVRFFGIKSIFDML